MSFRSILFLILLTPFSLNAQYYTEEEESDLPDGRWYISPDFGLVLGNVTMIEVAPTIGYQLTPRFSTGFGFRYEYFRRLEYVTRNELINTYKLGIRAFTKLILVPDLSETINIANRMGVFVYAEYEALNLDEEYYGLLLNTISERFWNHGILAGAGVSQQVSKKVFMNIMFLWDLTNSSSSPYIDPIIRVGAQIYFK